MSCGPELADFDVFERDGARPADIIGMAPVDPDAKPAVTLKELFSDESKLPARLQADLEALRAANAVVSAEVEFEEV